MVCFERQFQSKKGTSITEFIIFLVFLAPFFLLIAPLAKIAHFRMMTPQSVRYLAWQDVVGQSLSSAQSRAHVHERILKQGNNIFTEQQADTHSENQPSFWSLGQHQPMYNFSNNVAFDHTRTNSSSNTTMDTTAQSLIEFASIGPGRFTMQSNGFITHSVRQQIQTPFTSSHCANNTTCVNNSLTIYTNTLAPRDDQEIRSQVNSLKPFAHATQITRPIGGLLANTFVYAEAESLRTAPSHVNTETVPADRLR